MKLNKKDIKVKKIAEGVNVRKANQVYMYTNNIFKFC